MAKALILSCASSLYAPQHAHPLASLASGESHIRHIIIHDFIALSKERRQFSHAERIGRPLLARIERRIDEPHADQQPSAPQRQVNAPPIVRAHRWRQRAHTSVLQHYIKGTAQFCWWIK